jgi:hypothetical protein
MACQKTGTLLQMRQCRSGSAKHSTFALPAILWNINNFGCF